MDYAVKNIDGKIKNKKLTVSVPGSKSITARALLLAAMADGDSTLYGAQTSDDCTTFLNCVNALGVKTEINGTTINVSGCGGSLPVKCGEVYVGSAGTAARFISALLAFSGGTFTVTSSAQMAARPIKPLIDALICAGAQFTFKGEPYCFPFTVTSTRTPAQEIYVDVSQSSQFLSAVLMAAPCTGKTIKILPSGSHGMKYVDMTLDMMWSFGVDVKYDGGAYIVSGSYKGKKYEIEPDLSAACYFYAINRILGTEITVNGVMPRSMQGDRQFISLMQSGFNGGEVDMSTYSDQALTLAAIAPYLQKPTHICGIEHIRRQECDRIAAIVKNLTAMGVECKEEAGGVTIYPCTPHGAQIETFGDHRVAMSFAISGLKTDGVVIKNAEVCSKTFKEFFDVLDGVISKLCE
ncbi:MAG: 3-phosphoshikimate 1-carboxyvinyltransferase [Clostridia bacterium]|nr:3-phosphoshikimate 1-carboxyvinyltransferase [Clostridia bacterium]